MWWMEYNDICDRIAVTAGYMCYQMGRMGNGGDGGTMMDMLYANIFYIS